MHEFFNLIFQFTPLREGRLFPRVLLKCAFIFQFTPLREGRRTTPARPRSWPTYFNSRPYVRGDKRSPAGTASRSNFNSRPYVRGDAICHASSPG